MGDRFGTAVRAGIYATAIVAWILSSPERTHGATLNFAVGTFAEETFDPTMTSISAAIGVGGGMWNWLTEVTPKGELRPSIASSWTLEPDGRAWTFKLRDDVKFHDGSKMTADDVRFTFLQGVLRPEAKSSRSAQFRQGIANVKVIDATTVRFELSGTWPTLPYDISSQAGTEGIILPKAYIEKVGWATFAKQPVGTGPWKFVRQQAGDMVEFAAVKDHFATPPKFDALRLLLVPEESTRLAMLKSGQADIADVQVDSLKAAEGAGFKIAEDPQYTSIRIVFPGGHLVPTQPVHKLEVRKALNLAINRNEIVKALFAGRGQPAAIAPSSTLSIGYPKDLKPYPYNPAEAKKLLAQAGYPSGFDIRLYAFPLSGFNGHKELAEAVAGYWDAIGVRTTIVLTDLGAIRPKYVAEPPHSDILGQTMMFANTGRLNGLDDLSIFWHYTPRGNQRLAAKGEIDAQMERAAKAATVEGLAKEVTEAYEILYNNYRGVPIVDGLSAIWAYGNKLAALGERRPFRGYVTPDLAMAVPK
ncbi:MAG: peptide/nickel transport system substrate-binding protein [Alphaproteobacteria bacterium]|nr:peptide/nickel transport system substrate-binding protein [Alphaproteobacteria bacterium]